MATGPANGRLHTLVIALLIAGCTGDIDGPGSSSDPGGGGGGSSTPVEITGPAVRPHVQAFANAACGTVGACKPSTYAGHSPTADRAVDILASEVYGSVPTDDNALGDALADFALAHKAEFGITYVIWRQRINFADGGGWKPMEDRGSITKNHYDHVHTSFELEP